MKEQSRTITPAELKFWTGVKTYFFCDEDENLHWSDIAWMLAVGVPVLWVVLLGLGVMF